MWGSPYFSLLPCFLYQDTLWTHPILRQNWRNISKGKYRSKTLYGSPHVQKYQILRTEGLLKDTQLQPLLSEPLPRSSDHAMGVHLHLSTRVGLTLSSLPCLCSGQFMSMYSSKSELFNVDRQLLQQSSSAWSLSPGSLPSLPPYTLCTAWGV